MSDLSTLLGTPSPADPAVNLLDQTSNYLGTGGFSPIQSWESWRSRPDPTPILLNINIRISDILSGFLDLLMEPSVIKPLSKFLQTRGDKHV